MPADERRADTLRLNAAIDAFNARFVVVAHLLMLSCWLNKTSHAKARTAGSSNQRLT